MLHLIAGLKVTAAQSCRDVIRSRPKMPADMGQAGYFYLKKNIYILFLFYTKLPTELFYPLQIAKKYLLCLNIITSLVEKKHCFPSLVEHLKVF
jgi:hypothetical protein